jgi:hypothetical protein
MFTFESFKKNTGGLGRFHNWRILFSYACPGFQKYRKAKKKPKSSRNIDAMFDYTNIDHLYVYHQKKHEILSNQKSFEIDVGSILISSPEIRTIIFLFCAHFILLGLMKFIQKSFFGIDITSFILPEIGSIPGLRHLENFLENCTKNFKPLYVVTAEMKRQQKRELNKRYREKKKEEIKLSKKLYRKKKQR